MLTGPHILGVNGIGNGHDSFIAHTDLQVCSLNGMPEPQKQQEEAEGHRAGDDIGDKPGLVVDVLQLDDLIGSLRNDRGLVTSVNRQMEGITS